MVFDDLAEFVIPNVFCPTAESLELKIYCKALDGTFGFVPIHSMVLSYYIFTARTQETKSKLCIMHSVTAPAMSPKQLRGGCLEIEYASGIVIGEIIGD